MAWARIDDSAYTHPKLLDLDPAAVGLWAMGLSYCADHLTDGHIPRAQVVRLIAAPASRALSLAALLVKAGLWESRGNDGYAVHDFAQWNDSAETIRRKRQAHRDRQQRYWTQKAQSPSDASFVASPAPSGTASPDASVTGVYATPRHATHKPPFIPPSSETRHTVTHRPDGGLDLPPGAADWLHPDGCPRSEFLDRFPPDFQRQCRDHRAPRTPA